MPTSILTTKLYIPSRPNAVLRPRLLERLNEGLHRKLVLVSAPTSFGKTTLVSEWIAGCERPVAWLSLDEEHHVIDATAVDKALSFLLEHQPSQMHLVIATREDPPLPLARLRARGQLTELRAVDLRFIPSEAAEFLNQMMNLKLSAEEIAALETRTEGGITGLQLAALSMQGQKDVKRRIEAVARARDLGLV